MYRCDRTSSCRPEQQVGVSCALGSPFVTACCFARGSLRTALCPQTSNKRFAAWLDNARRVVELNQQKDRKLKVRGTGDSHRKAAASSYVHSPRTFTAHSYVLSRTHLLAHS